MTVGLSGRRAAALRETAAMMEPVGRHLLLPGDLTLPALRHELKESLLNNWGGRLDVLVNNAGTVHVAPIICTGDDDISLILTTNVLVPAALSRNLQPLLRKAAPSRIVNVGSMFGDIAYPLFSVYSASKFALRGLSDSLRRELKPSGIGVTSAAPRATRTSAVTAYESLHEPFQMSLDAPEVVAERIWRSVEREADTAYARGPERLFVFIQRLFPKIIDGAISRQMADRRVETFVDAFSPAVNEQATTMEDDNGKSNARSASDCVTGLAVHQTGFQHHRS
jgi:short-subunit dehydrogenase